MARRGVALRRDQLLRRAMRLSRQLLQKRLQPLIDPTIAAPGAPHSAAAHLDVGAARQHQPKRRERQRPAIADFYLTQRAAVGHGGVQASIRHSPASVTVATSLTPASRRTKSWIVMCKFRYLRTAWIYWTAPHTRLLAAVCCAVRLAVRYETNCRNAHMES